MEPGRHILWFAATMVLIAIGAACFHRRRLTVLVTRCPCGYSFEGLPDTSVCPECGGQTPRRRLALDAPAGSMAGAILGLVPVLCGMVVAFGAEPKVDSDLWHWYVLIPFGLIAAGGLTLMWFMRMRPLTAWVWVASGGFALALVPMRLIWAESALLGGEAASVLTVPGAVASIIPLLALTCILISVPLGIVAERDRRR